MKFDEKFFLLPSIQLQSLKCDCWRQQKYFFNLIFFFLSFLSTRQFHSQKKVERDLLLINLSPLFFLPPSISQYFCCSCNFLYTNTKWHICCIISSKKISFFLHFLHFSHSILQLRAGICCKSHGWCEFVVGSLAGNSTQPKHDNWK